MKNYFCPKAAVEAGKKNIWEFKMLTLNSLKLKVVLSRLRNVLSN